MKETQIMSQAVGDQGNSINEAQELAVFAFGELICQWWERSIHRSQMNHLVPLKEAFIDLCEQYDADGRDWDVMKSLYPALTRAYGYRLSGVLPDEWSTLAELVD